MRKMMAALVAVAVAAGLVANLSSAAEGTAKKTEGKAAVAAEKKEAVAEKKEAVAEKKEAAAEKKEAAAEKKEAAAEEKEAAAEEKEAGEAPETILLDKTGKLAPVKFPHKLHAEKAGGCPACHEGKEPLFAKKKAETGMKMADMYAGKTCGSCHDGKKAFAAKAGCMKCHKK